MACTYMKISQEQEQEQAELIESQLASHQYKFSLREGVYLPDTQQNEAARGVLFGEPPSSREGKENNLLYDFIGQYEYARKSPSPDWSIVDAALDALTK